MPVLLVLISAVIAVGSGQAQILTAPNPRLTLGISSGTSGIEIEVPLTLTPAKDGEVGKIQAEITFPSEIMSFLKVSQYLAVDQEVKIEAKVQNDEVVQNDEIVQSKELKENEPPRSRLEITLESPTKPLPAGILTTLVFQFAEEVEPQIIGLGLSARMWAFPDLSQEITAVETYEGRISIQEPDVFFGCFFYMH